MGLTFAEILWQMRCVLDVWLLQIYLRTMRLLIRPGPTTSAAGLAKAKHWWPSHKHAPMASYQYWLAPSSIAIDICWLFSSHHVLAGLHVLAPVHQAAQPPSLDRYGLDVKANGRQTWMRSLEAPGHQYASLAQLTDLKCQRQQIPNPAADQYHESS